MVASVVLALLNLPRHYLVAGGFAVMAFLWWLVFVRWRRVIDAG